MIRSLILSLTRGFVMGAADIVPGVSGGTVALVFGIYERLIASIKAGSSALGHILRADVAGFRKWMGRIDWAFILPLGAGLITAVLLLAPVLGDLLIDRAVIMAALFSGLVLGSMVVAWAMIRNPERRHIWIGIGVAVSVFVVLGLRGGTTSDTVNQIQDPAMLAFFVSGALAITAMILPGISGSFILILIGMYLPVLEAAAGRDVTTLAVFMLGAVIGLALFSQILHRALTLHHDSVIAGLVGLMGGSLRVLWPWPNGVFSTSMARPDSDVIISALVAIAGFAIVIVVARFAQRLEAEDQARSAIT